MLLCHACRTWRMCVRWRRWGLKRSSWKCEVFLAVSPLILVSLKYLLSIPVMRFLVPFRWIKNLVNLISLQISISHRQWHLLTRKTLKTSAAYAVKSCKNLKEQSLRSFNVWNGRSSWLKNFQSSLKRTLRKFIRNIFATRIPTEDLLFQLHGWRTMTMIAESVQKQKKLRKVEGLRRYEEGENPSYLTRLELFRPLALLFKILTYLPKTCPIFDSMNFQRSLSFPKTLKKNCWAQCAYRF